ncbi:MAG: discoidin domain-containing protein, partial [Thermoanaerobaculia bacterium]
VLARARLDPEALRADARVAGARLPDLLLFRDRVNRYFYRKGEDGNACADCHATHTILGLAEPPADGRPLTDGEVIGNYRSVLKVINTADPEQSLVLRKPRSPFGTGQSSDQSPTGLTHVGGTRWRDGSADEAYQALLAFVRSARAAGKPVPRAASADSYSPEYPPALAADGDPETLWHTEFVGASPGHPHELVLDLQSPREVAGLTYLPRADSPNGRVRDFEVYLSEDGKEWGKPLARGSWADDQLPKIVLVAPSRARYLKLRGLSEVRGQPYMSAAEVNVILGPATPPAPKRARL